MKLRHLSAAALCIGMMLVACQKDKDSSGTRKQTASTEKASDDPMANLFRDFRNKYTQTFQFEGKQGIEFTGNEGTVITVRPGGLTRLDGSVYHGPVVASLFEIQDYSSIALGGFPTQSLWNEQNPEGGAPISTAGAVVLEMETPDGEQLTSEGNNVTIAIPVEEGEEFNPDMKIWEGEPSVEQPRDNSWKELEEVPENIGNQYYLFNWEGRDRLNVDCLYSCPGTPTPFKVDLPAGFNKTNTEIYVLAHLCPSTGRKAVFSLDVYNPAPIWWTEHTAAGLPVGTVVDFVAIANIGGVTFFKVETATIVPGHFQHMSGMTPTPISVMTGILNSL